MCVYNKEKKKNNKKSAACRHKEYMKLQMYTMQQDSAK
jgi:hypothetical protein